MARGLVLTFNLRSFGEDDFKIRISLALGNEIVQASSLCIFFFFFTELHLQMCSRCDGHFPVLKVRHFMSLNTIK